MSIKNRKSAWRHPSSIGDALQMCVDHGLRKHNRPIKRIADLMGIKIDTLYKYLAESRMPVNLIAPFENACGATFLTQHLCANAHLLAVEMPTGRKLKQIDVMQLQKHFAEATAMLIEFYEQHPDADGDQTTDELTALMAELGWHRANVQRTSQPQLAFDGAADQ